MNLNTFVSTIATAAACCFLVPPALAESCSSTCVYKHVGWQMRTFAIKTDACDIADCYPIPPHHHDFVPERPELMSTPEGKTKLSADNHSALGTTAKARSANQAGHGHTHAHRHAHAHSHAHGHTHHHGGALASTAHDHGEKLTDQPVIFLDKSTGERYVYNPKRAQLETLNAEKPTERERIGEVELQSAHMVDFCRSGTTTCDVDK